MSRRDGAPTNFEMLTTFTETSRTFYNETIGVAVAQGLHPGYEDKPLTAIRAVVVHDSSDAANPTRPDITAELVDARPVWPHELDYLCIDLPERHRPDSQQLTDLKRRARRVAGVLLQPGLADVESIVEPGPMLAKYSFLQEGNRQWWGTNTFDERSSKKNITAGQALAERALRYIRSGPAVDLSFRRELQMPSRDIDGSIAISLALDVYPALPLNGFEPRSFLVRFWETMERNRKISQHQVERLEEVEAPNVLIDSTKQRVAALAMAAKRAQNMLEK